MIRRLKTEDRRAVLTAAALLVAISAGEIHAQQWAPRAAPREVRAIWVTRWDYRTEVDVRRAIRGAASLGLNRVLFQVRGRADAFYRSSFEPWGEELGGKDPGFDPLSVAIDEAKRNDIALDAWINVMPGWKGSRPPQSRKHLYYRRPEWFLTDQKGQRHRLEKNRYAILNPCLPEVRSYLVAIVKDIATRYPISGLHLDYVRFVARNPHGGLDFPYDSRTLSLFHEHAGDVPSKLPDRWDRWRQLNMNTVVYRISKAFREIRPGAPVSVAAIKNYDHAKKMLFQDVVTWQRRGWIDEVFPMTYDKAEASFARLAVGTVQSGLPRKVYPGIGVYMLDRPEQLAAQIERIRRIGAGGYALFALSNFFPTTSHESHADQRAERLRNQMRQTVVSANEERLSMKRSREARERQ